MNAAEAQLAAFLDSLHAVTDPDMLDRVGPIAVVQGLLATAAGVAVVYEMPLGMLVSELASFMSIASKHKVAQETAAFRKDGN